MSPPRIVMEGVVFTYGDRTILDGADLVIEAGRLVGVVGPSGVGKSTLLGLISGELTPSSGAVTYASLPTSGGRLRSTAVGWVMQSTNTFGRRSVLDNVAMPALVAGVARRSAVRTALDALDRVGLGEMADRRCATLSGGEVQRVAVARALAAGSPVLLADEPTASLDRDNRDRLTEVLVAAASVGRIVIVATHDAAVAGRCDDLVEL